MAAPRDIGEPEDWPGPLPGFRNVSNDDEQALAALEPAWGKAATAFRTGFRFGHRAGEMRFRSLEELHRFLGVFEKRAQSGDTLALLQAIGVCAEENVPLPAWLAIAYQAQMAEFARPGGASSLDTVFADRDVPTGAAKRAAAARLDWQLGALLWHDLWTLVQTDESLLSFDAAVVRLLAAKSYGVAKTKAKALIDCAGARQSAYLGKDLSVSRFLAKRRKRVTRP